jgi:hypothetical protein
MPAQEQLLLQPDRPLRLNNARHAELRVDSGTVWITASGAAGDVFLAAGASYLVPLKGQVLVEAVRGAALVSLVAYRAPLLEWFDAWRRGALPGPVAQP